MARADFSEKRPSRGGHFALPDFWKTVSWRAPRLLRFGGVLVEVVFLRKFRQFYFSHRPSPLINSTLRSNTLQGVDFGSILGQFLVSSVKND